VHVDRAVPTQELNDLLGFDRRKVIGDYVDLFGRNLPPARGSRKKLRKLCCAPAKHLMGTFYNRLTWIAEEIGPDSCQYSPRDVRKGQYIPKSRSTLVP